MASTASPEASEIRRRGRQRLIGAIALVMLLVVFVPMILDSEPRPSQPVAPIPARDNAPALPAPKPAPPAPAPQAVTPQATTPQAVTPAKAGAQSSSAAPDAALAKPSPPAGSVPKPAPAAEVKAAPKLEGFAVQVGAFRDEAKLKQARERLVASGVVHFTERLEAQGGPLTRLRAGPFPTREAAESAQATLKRSGLDGKVVPLP
jgi:DedD protein